LAGATSLAPEESLLGDAHKEGSDQFLFWMTQSYWHRGRHIHADEALAAVNNNPPYLTSYQVRKFHRFSWCLLWKLQKSNI
jgi:hypothetical protein